MALIKCSECKKEISTKADKCPHCGAPVKKKSGCGTLLIVLFGVIVVTSIATQFTDSSGQKSAPAPSPTAPTRYSGYDELKRKFDGAIAEKYKELLAAKTAGNRAEMSRLVNQFKNFKRLDYENVGAIAHDVLKEETLERLGRTPETDLKSRAEIYSDLAKLEPANSDYVNNAAKYSSAWKAAEAQRIEAERKAAAERQRIAARKTRIERQFSAWDGSHRALEQIIKKTMNDPDSYKHVETRYSESDDAIVVKTTFRGKNAFGGVVTNSIRAKFTLDGELIAIIDQGP